jgi:hypothetical protein
VTTRATLLRIIQSIPSPRAEPFRLWLAQVGDERLEEIENPEAAIERIRELYRARGHTEAWIEARIRNDLARNDRDTARNVRRSAAHKGLQPVRHPHARLHDLWRERDAVDRVEHVADQRP